MRLDVLHRRKPPASPASLLLRDAWKYGVGIGIAAVLFTAGGVDTVQPHRTGNVLASSVLPTTVPCGPIATDAGDSHTATWTATSSPYGTGSPYNLPISSTNNPDPTVPSCDGIIVPPDVTLKIDPSLGDVQVFSHGAAILVEGGHLVVPGTGATNSALFDAEPDVASWDGIIVTATDASHRGNVSMAYASTQHALNSITITSGAVSTPDPTNLISSLPYGLALINSGVGPSYFDGIDSTNTPVLVKGRADPSTHRADGQFGTVNNIGSQGIKLNFDSSAPTVTANALDIENVTFGSSVPFAETSCLPLQQPCSAGSIGNDAILGTFTAANPPPVFINQSRFYRAGSFGVELNGSLRPVIKDNNFDCNGSGSPKPKETCVGTGLKYSAIYLNNATADLETSVTNNVGHEDGLDAIAFNGTIVYGSGVSPQVLTWKNATNDAANDHLLGYLLNGDLNLNGGTLVVPGGSVVKSKGAINLTGAAIDASAAGPKVFTSLRDNVNITSCPSVFVQSCPSPLPAGEWGGIDLVGSALDSTIRSATKGTITNSTILYATTGVRVSNGTSLTITGSTIGPTFADGVFAEGTPIAVSATTFGCPTGVCSGPSSGNHGIFADFRNAGPLVGGLKVGGSTAADKNTFKGSVNEAIRGLGLAGQVVDVENNDIQNAGATGSAGSAGIYLQGADNLTLKTNRVVGSGTGILHYPAIQLDGVSNADFRGPISNNTGSGNGLDAIAFHGDAKTLTWQTIGAGALLGYLVDGNLTVNGALTLAANDYAPILGGGITVKGGGITTNGAVLTSLKEQGPHVPSCGSVFVPKASGVCPAATAGDWNGLVLDPGRLNSLTTSEIRYAKTGITMDKPTASGTPPTNLQLDRTNIRNVSADGIATKSPLSISKGTFSNLAGRGIAVDLSAAGTGAALALDQLTIRGTGADGVQAIGLADQGVTITNLTVDHAGAFGLNLKDANQLTLKSNTVTNTASTFPAIYLNGFSGLFANVRDNRGALNGIDAIAFHGTVTDDLTWQTARKTGDPTKLLGYLLDETLTMRPGKTLTVNAGDIVKVGKAVGNGGLLDLQGVNLWADNTVSSSQKVFTSLSDNSAGVVACPSALLPGCTGASIGDWGGISLSGSGANAALVNAVVRYASTGISINSEASSTSGSNIFGLVVSGSSIGPSSGDGIKAVKTSVSVTNSTVTGGTHGVSVDYSGAMPATALRLSGDRFTSTSAEAILGQALGGLPAWISDNTVQAAGTFGIRLSKSDSLVLRNNNVSQSGGGPGAGASGYPAIYLDGVSADFARNVRGNVGSGNGLDVIAFHGTVYGDLSWRTPAVNASPLALGYVLDGSLTITDGTFTVHPGDVVKSVGGPITVKGGTLDASVDTDTRPKVFTSLRDPSAYPQTCPSILTGACTSGAQPGDWGGVVITNDISGHTGSGSIAYGDMRFAGTALTIDVGPTASFGTSNVGLIVKATAIADVTGDGVNAQDTPISVKTTTIQRAGVHGVVATFLGGTPCTTACSTSLDVETVTVMTTSKDGIVASGLGGRPTIVSSNTISGAGTYGIRLAGADQLTLNDNTVTGSGGPTTTFRYPAIYLGAVKADFELTAGTSTVARNHGSGNGLDALVLHGEATQPLAWLTTGLLAPPALPLVPSDHFGYILDGGLIVHGNLTTQTGDAVKVLTGTIQVNGAVLSTGTTFTSLKDGAVLVKACDSGFDSVFVQRTSGACPAPAAGDWGGITANAGSTLTNTTIGFDDGLTVTGGALTFTGGGMHDIAKNAIVVNGSPLSVTNAVFAGIGNDAIDSTNSGSMDTITDDQFDHVAGVAINLQNAPADLERNIFTNDASPAVKTSGAAVTLQCSSVQSGGITGDAGLTVKENDLASSVVVTAPAGASAENNWWGQGTGPSSQLSGGVTVTTYFTTQNPTAAVAITGKPSTTQPLDPVRADGSLGTGLVQATLTFSRNMNPEATQPAVSYASSPVAFTGAWKTNDPRTWIGTAPIDSSLATNTTHTVSADGARDCVPDPLHNLMTHASNTFVADTTSVPLVSVGSPDLIGAQSARLHGHIDPNGWATGAVHSGQFVVVNVAPPFDLHTYPTPPLADKTTPLDFALTVTGLNSSATYAYQLQVPSVNGTAFETTADTVMTTGPASKLLITDPPPNVAGTPIDETVTALDSGGNTVADYTGPFSVTNSDLQATWQRKVNPQAPALFPASLNFDLADHGSVALSVTFKTAGSQTLTAAASGLTSATLPETITAAPASQLAYTTTAQTITAGVISGTITVQQQDPYGNAVNVSGSDLALTITSSNVSNGSFFEADGTTALISPKITVGNSTTSFTYKDTTAGSPMLTAHNSGLNDGTQIETVTAASLDHLVLSPSTAAITAGGSEAFTAQGQDVYNNSLGDVTSSTTFTITPDGSCTGASCTATVADASSHHTVTGTDSGKTGTASLTVDAAALDHLVLSPSTAAITAGGSQTYTAQGEDLYNNSLGDVTSSTTFTMTPDGSCTGASCTATVADASSHHTVTGTDSGKTGTASLTVNAGALDHLVLSPPTPTIMAGGSQAFTAQGQDVYNNSVGDVTSATTFTIAPDGSCTVASCTATVADASSHHTVTGTDSGKTGTASLTVNAAALDHLVLSPSTAAITAGGSQTYTAQGEDLYNNSLGDVTSSTTFTITPDGSCTGASCTATVPDSGGSHTVTGSDGGKTGTASLTVS